LLENRLVTPDLETARLLDVHDGGTVLDVQALYDGPVTRDTPAVFVHLGLVTDASPDIQRIVEAGRVPQFEVGGPSLVMQLREQFKVELGYSISTVTAIVCARKEARILGVPERAATLCVDLIGHSVFSRPVLKIRAIPHNKHAGLKFLLRY
jgi:DNA-binding GntR family transcriptional regulator